MNSKKLSKIPLIVAGLLIILNRILVTGVQITPDASNVYFYYAISKGFALLGFNIVPLYLGYYSNYFKNKNTLSKISELSFIYLLANFISALLLTIINHTKTLKDFWNFLFPISQNLYPYAVSIALVFILLPFVIKFFDQLTDKQMKQLFYISSFLAVIVPSLFNIDVWSMNAGGRIFLNLYLLVLGYYSNRANLLNSKWNFLKFLGTWLVYVLSTWIMSYTTVLVHENFSTFNRFNVNYSIFAVITSLFLFNWLNEFKINKIPFSAVYTFLIVTVVAMYQPISITIMVKSLFVKNAAVSALRRVSIITQDFTILLLLVLILTIIILLINKIPAAKGVIEKCSFSSVDELFKKIENIKQFFIKNKKIM